MGQARERQTRRAESEREICRGDRASMERNGKRARTKGDKRGKGDIVEQSNAALRQASPPALRSGTCFAFASQRPLRTSLMRSFLREKHGTRAM